MCIKKTPNQHTTLFRQISIKFITFQLKLKPSAGRITYQVPSNFVDHHKIRITPPLIDVKYKIFAKMQKFLFIRGNHYIPTLTGVINRLTTWSRGKIGDFDLAGYGRCRETNIIKSPHHITSKQLSRLDKEKIEGETKAKLSTT